MGHYFLDDWGWFELKLVRRSSLKSPKTIRFSERFDSSTIPDSSFFSTGERGAKHLS